MGDLVINARDFFRKGDPVIATPRAFANNVFSGSFRIIHGTVTGFGRDPWTVRVRHRGLMNPETYHFDFWCPTGRSEEAS